MSSGENNSEYDPHAPLKRVAFFRFYEELNDHLPEAKRKKSFRYEFTGKPSVKNVVESMGVPHSEIDLILVDGTSVDFNYQMTGGETISVYPVFESFDISPVIRLRPKPLRETRFVVDVNLGKLAVKLRLLGFDSLFRNNFEDDEIIRIAKEENRIILTRDKAMLGNNEITHAYWIRNDDPKKQLREVVARLDLKNHFKPFSRCSVCNSQLNEAGKEAVKADLPEETLKYYDKFWKCIGCGQIYWQGSHYKHIQNLINELRQL